MGNNKPETLPIPCVPIADMFARIIEIGNDRKGRVESFLKRFEEQHPYKEDCPKPEAITLSTKDTDDGTEYCFRIAPKKRGDKVCSVRIKLKGERSLDGENPAASKLLQLILSKTIQTSYNIRQGIMHTPEILITPDELEVLGIFDNSDSARAHLNDALLKVGSIWLKVAVAVDGVRQTTFVPMIASWTTDEQRHWVIRLEKDLPYWGFLLPYYCRFPVKGFKLKNKAFSILRYIMLLSNLNKSKIKKEGYFTLTIDSIIDRLLLNRNDKHKKFALVEPVKLIVDEINELNCGVQLKIDTINDSTQAFLNGKVRVYLTEELLTEWKASKRVAKNKEER